MSKLLSITIRDIRVNKDINESINGESITNQQNDIDADPNLGIVDFRNKKVPSSIVKFAQVMKNKTFNEVSMLI